MSYKPSPISVDSRGVSPAIGVVLIIGFVVLVAMGLFLFGQGLITGDENPRIDANFQLEIENTSNIDMTYDTGDDFTSDNTDSLFVIGENASGEQIEPITLYDGASVSETSESVLSENTTVLSQERIEEESEEGEPHIEPGASLQIVWEPSAQDDTQLVLDEVVVPDESTIIVQTDGGGLIVVGDGSSIDVGGCDPRQEDCEENG